MAPNLAVDKSNVSYGVPSHTVACMLLPPCLNSGFVLRNKSPSGLYTTSYNITNSSIPVIREFLTKGTTRPDNVLVNATGSIDAATGALVLTSLVDAIPVQRVTVIGFLYDNLCLYMAGGIAIDGTNVTYGVPDHTVGCMTKVQKCVDSGFVVRQLSSSGAYTTAYNLTNSSTPVVTGFLNSLTRLANVYAKASAEVQLCRSCTYMWRCRMENSRHCRQWLVHYLSKFRTLLIMVITQYITHNGYNPIHYTEWLSPNTLHIMVITQYIPGQGLLG